MVVSGIEEIAYLLKKLKRFKQEEECIFTEDIVVGLLKMVKILIFFNQR